MGDSEERELAERKRQRAFSDVTSLVRRHRAPAFRHAIMRRAGELQIAHLEELKRDMRKRVETEVRQELEKDRGAFEEERQKLRAEVEGQRKDLMAKEEQLERRCEEEWSRMRCEFEERARDLAREDLEPIAKDIVEQTEKKHKGRRCV